jgi:hypothetical protein
VAVVFHKTLQHGPSTEAQLVMIFPAFSGTLMFVTMLTTATRDHTMSLAVTHQPLTAEAWVQSQISPFEICG